MEPIIQNKVTLENFKLYVTKPLYMYYIVI